MLANPGKSSVDLSTKIKREIPLLFRKGIPIDENFQTLRQAKFGKKLLTSHLPRVEHRNCGMCARIGYHAEIFNFPWLVRCPIHTNETITSHCPACASKWSAIPKRNQYQCSVCGDIRLPQLIANGAFENNLDYSRLENLINLVKEFEIEKRYCLHSGISLREAILTLGPTDCYFPSVVAAIRPSAKRTFFATQVQLPPCVVKHGRIEEQVNIKKYLSSKRNDLSKKNWIVDAEDRVATAVLKYLKPLHSCKNKLDKNEHADNRRDRKICTYCVTFKTWRQFLGTRGSNELGKIDILAHDLHRFYLSKNFYTPEPMQFFWSYDGNNCYSTEPPDVAHLMPLQLQEAIYEVDLWTSFLNTLTIVDLALTRTNNLVNSYPCSIPNFQKHPLSVHITIDSSSSIKVILPKVNLS